MIKSAVIKEIHHRVKNNLQTIASLLRLQMRRSNSQEVEKVFRESINRIMSISIIHEVLSQDGLEEVDCKEIFEYMSKGISPFDEGSGAIDSCRSRRRRSLPKLEECEFIGANHK